MHGVVSKQYLKIYIFKYKYFENLYLLYTGRLEAISEAKIHTTIIKKTIILIIKYTQVPMELQKLPTCTYRTQQKCHDQVCESSIGQKALEKVKVIHERDKNQYSMFGNLQQSNIIGLYCIKCLQTIDFNLLRSWYKTL